MPALMIMISTSLCWLLDLIKLVKHVEKRTLYDPFLLVLLCS